MSYVPKLPERNDNVSPDHPLLDVAWLLGGAVLILAVFWWVLGFAVDYAVDRLPPGFEQRLAARMEGPAPAARPGPRAARAQAALDRLLRHAGPLSYEHRLTVADGEMVNAFALPGGRIVLMQGLLEQAASENELAMVLAHELGHFAHRDHLRGLGRGLALSALAAVFLGSDSNVANVLMGTAGLAQARYSRGQETAADLYGLELLQRAYGHVGGATDFFERMARQRGQSVDWLSSHPLSADRAAGLRQEAGRRGWAEGETLPLP